MNDIIVHHGNCLDVVLTIGQVDAIVTDPPYHLLQASRGGSLRFNDPTTPFGRVGGGSKGFMHEEWDGGDIAFKLETWRRLGRALKPGGYLLAFGGSRTWHRLACAIEDAGFVIQDTIAWVYGSGFPKGKNLLKPAFEPVICARKEFNADPNWDVIAEFTTMVEALLWMAIPASNVDAQNDQTGNSVRWLAHVLSQSDQYARTDTFRLQEAASTCLSIALLWNTTLDALSTHESTFTTEMESSLTTGLRTLSSWILASIPASITQAVSLRGGLWSSAKTAARNSNVERQSWSGIPTPSAQETVTPHTASAILSTLAEIAASSSLLPRVTVENFALPSAPIGSTTALDGAESQSLALSVAPFLRLSQDEIRNIAVENAWPRRIDFAPNLRPIIVAYKPGGKRELQIDECRVESASRLWREPCRNQESDDNRNCYSKGLAGSISVENTTIGRWPANLCHDGSDEVLALFPDSKGQQGHSTDAQRSRASTYGATSDAGKEYAPRGDTGSAARFFYCAKASRRDRAGSTHPTIKPQALMRWLVQLVTPPGGTVLDPFAGSGSTGQAALAVGRKAILIEQEAHWIADINHRLELCDKQQEFDL